MMCNGMVCDMCDGDEMFEHFSWLSDRYSLKPHKKDEQLKVESR